MAIIRTNPIGEQQSRPAPEIGFAQTSIPAANDLGTFGGNQARDMQIASGFVEKAAATTNDMAMREMRDANEARVQDLANGFISGQQFTLYTDKDAFYRKKGQDAINGAQAATDRLLELKKDAIGLAANSYQRNRLGEMLDAQIKSATDGIGRHVATQSMEWQKNVAEGRQALTRNQAALQYNDTGAIDGLALAAETTAREQAKLAGVAGTDAETALVAKARSDIYATAIAQRLQNDEKRAALALYDKVKGKLDEKDNIRLAAAMKSTATDVAAEDWIGRNAPNEGRQEVRRFWEAKGYSPEASAALAGHAGAESGFNPGARNRGDGRDGSDSVGLYQWNADRSKALAKFARDNKLDPGERRTQLEFAAWELENTEKDAGTKLKGAKTLEDANKAAFGYLRPAVQTGRMDLVQAAFNDTGVGFDKANSKGLVQAALSDPGISLETKSAIATKLNRESASIEASRSATIRGLTDSLEAETQAMIASPSSYKKGTLSAIADGLEAAGDKSLAVNTRLLASMEDTLLNFSAAPKSAQDETLRTVAAALLPGKSKALADSMIALGKKDAAEAAKFATEELAGLKTAAAAGVRMETLEAKAKVAIDAAVKAGDFTKAREITDFYDAQVTAQAVNRAPPAQAAAAIAAMRAKVEAGEQTNTAIKQLDAMQDVQKKQAAAFDKDALATGASVYAGQLGPLPPMENLAARAAYATQISKLQNGRPVLPFTEPEIETLRTKIDTAPPDQQAKTMMALSALPPESLTGVAAALAGKGDTGDMLSRSYAAALSFYADRDPASVQIANQILGGARITKEMGDAGKKAPTSSQAWQTNLNDRIGNIFFDMKGTPAVIADAVASVYTYQMHKAGRQGETVDTDVLDRAITTVIGKPVTRNGQAFLPPVKGMETYEVDRAVRSITDADLAGLRTTEGDPITADVLARRGLLTNAGAEGTYFVRIPDPRAGMEPRPVVDAEGRPWRLDLRPFVERSRTNAVPPPDTGPAAARRRAPANPTDGLAP